MVDYEGILGGYPEIEKRAGRLASVLQLIRPYTLMAPLIAGILGTLAPTTFTLEHMITGLFCGITLALSQACGQVLNQYSDYKLDEMVKPYRPIPKKIISREEALGIGWLLAIISIGRGFTTGYLFGSINLVLIFFAVFYSVAPLSPRRIHWLPNVLWMAFSRGFLPVVAVYSVFGHIQDALTYAVLCFLWVLALQSTKDIPDTIGDRAFKIKTIPVAHGVNGLRIWIMVMTLIYAVTGMLLAKPIYVATFVALMLLAVITLSTDAKITENTIAWVIFYAGLGLHYILMFI